MVFSIDKPSFEGRRSGAARVARGAIDRLGHSRPLTRRRHGAHGEQRAFGGRRAQRLGGRAGAHAGALSIGVGGTLRNPRFVREDNLRRRFDDADAGRGRDTAQRGRSGQGVARRLHRGARDETRGDHRRLGGERRSRSQLIVEPAQVADQRRRSIEVGRRVRDLSLGEAGARLRLDELRAQARRGLLVKGTDPDEERPDLDRCDLQQERLGLPPRRSRRAAPPRRAPPARRAPAAEGAAGREEQAVVARPATTARSSWRAPCRS
jgi:hypothetical protein